MPVHARNVFSFALYAPKNTVGHLYRTDGSSDVSITCNKAAIL